MSDWLITIGCMLLALPLVVLMVVWIGLAAWDAIHGDRAAAVVLWMFGGVGFIALGTILKVAQP